MTVEAKVEWGTARQDIEADSDFTKPQTEQLLKVDLACGTMKRDGFIGIDIVQTEKTDIVHDLLKFPWPLKDASVLEFHCSHFVEHIPIQLDDKSYGLQRFMEEVWRCLTPGGTIVINAPYYTSMRAWQDPTHTRAITDVTFNYFNKEQAKNMTVDHYSAMNCNFKVLTMTYGLLPEYEALSDEARTYAAKHYFNVVADIGFVLQKIDL